MCQSMVRTHTDSRNKKNMPKGGGCSMVSYKNISRIVTVLSFIAIFIVTNQDFLISSVPIEYQTLVQLIVLVAGFFVTQFSEEKRVVRAEELVEEAA